jgi:gliding motility-associated lipoprotein GldD
MPDSFSRFLFVSLFLVFFTACNEDYYPKPRGFFRIDLPEKNYNRFDSTYPYTFEYPWYAQIVGYPQNTGDQKYWINIRFPGFRGKVHVSYKEIDSNLNEYIEDSRTMAMKHIPKASGIKTERYSNPDRDVYGLTYAIEGVEAASVFQFYLTDSTTHFLRGALYFDVVPNNDSLAPVIEFLKADIRHLVESFEWKEIKD